MLYIKGNHRVEVIGGGYHVLEALGYKSEWVIESEKKMETNLAKFRKIAARRWTCPECGKELPALKQNKHHAWHQKGGR